VATALVVVVEASLYLVEQTTSRPPGEWIRELDRFGERPAESSPFEERPGLFDASAIDEQLREIDVHGHDLDCDSELVGETYPGFELSLCFVVPPLDETAQRSKCVVAGHYPLRPETFCGCDPLAAHQLSVGGSPEEIEVKTMGEMGRAPQRLLRRVASRRIESPAGVQRGSGETTVVVGKVAEGHFRDGCSRGVLRPPRLDGAGSDGPGPFMLRPRRRETLCGFGQYALLPPSCAGAIEDLIDRGHSVIGLVLLNYSSHQGYRSG
jgi:hypothetical protein